MAGLSMTVLPEAILVTAIALTALLLFARLPDHQRHCSSGEDLMTSTRAPLQMPDTQQSRTEVTIMNSWTSAEWDAVAERSLTHDPARPAPIPAPAGTVGLAIALALVGAA
jgi:hypothetical protein